MNDRFLLVREHVRKKNLLFITNEKNKYIFVTLITCYIFYKLINQYVFLLLSQALSFDAYPIKLLLLVFFNSRDYTATSYYLLE